MDGICDGAFGLSGSSRSMPEAIGLLEEISVLAGKKELGRLSRGGPTSRRLVFVRSNFDQNRRYCTVSCRLSVWVVAPLVTFTGTI
jgi:hypothetical protein